MTPRVVKQLVAYAVDMVEAEAGEGPYQRSDLADLAEKYCAKGRGRREVHTYLMCCLEISREKAATKAIKKTAEAATAVAALEFFARRCRRPCEGAS